MCPIMCSFTLQKRSERRNLKKEKKKKENSKLFMTKLFDEIMKLVLNYFKNNLLLILFIIEFRKIERKIRRDIQQ